MIKKNRKSSILSLILVLFLFFSCVNQNSNNNTLNAEANQNSEKPEPQNKNVKTIFYNIPSPLEMAEILQNANSSYDSEILNTLNNIDQYTSNTSMALNLGVYGADLSYTRLFDQMQLSINYLAAIRKLSVDLGIPQDEDSFAINRLEKNVNNKDSILYIITNIYTNANVYLKENERKETAALIIVGGWIEALYISTNLLDESNPNQEIMERIAEQKMSINNVISLLKENSHSSEYLKDIYSQFEDLKNAFNKITIIQQPGSVITDKKNKTTIINHTNIINVNFEQISEIKNINNRLRKLIIS